MFIICSNLYIQHIYLNTTKHTLGVKSNEPIIINCVVNKLFNVGKYLDTLILIIELKHSILNVLPKASLHISYLIETPAVTLADEWSGNISISM